MRFVLASGNKGKLREMRAILGELGFEVLSPEEAGYNPDVEETGATFEENALLKARAASEATGLASIADDSGLCVFALGGAPGVYSARYGGGETDTGRYALLLKNMEGITDRRAKFVSSIACVFPDGGVLTARGECLGEILYAPRGTGGFGYDPVFLVAGTQLSMAELTEAEKNRISHRAMALLDFKRKLSNIQ